MQKKSPMPLIPLFKRQGQREAEAVEFYEFETSLGLWETVSQEDSLPPKGKDD